MVAAKNRERPSKHTKGALKVLIYRSGWENQKPSKRKRSAALQAGPSLPPCGRPCWRTGTSGRYECIRMDRVAAKFCLVWTAAIGARRLALAWTQGCQHQLGGGAIFYETSSRRAPNNVVATTHIRGRHSPLQGGEHVEHSCGPPWTL